MCLIMYFCYINIFTHSKFKLLTYVNYLPYYCCHTGKKGGHKLQRNNRTQNLKLFYYLKQLYSYFNNIVYHKPAQAKITMK